jgi:hypothetical protein
MAGANGKAVKDLLRSYRLDPSFREHVLAARSLLEAEERS